ncbi:cupin domain-containing protein [Candidatus Bipolaricaulota bacterium]|nr:cupin domain-containing protein [Candidatus Bipolaricaulota bacterium]
MISVRKSEDFEKREVTDLDEAENVEKEVLLGDPEGVETFAMRRFTLGNGGHTPYHYHNWEHEIYVLDGRGKIRTEQGGRELSGGDAVYVPSNEKHQLVSESEGFAFLCLVPRRGEPTISEE